ncbi:PAS domain-containing protein [Geobacter pelophilus]|uniref:histidine kinase n=1 Tax=Geoanaerobacter pelophilus TaxID=60036 RepID=A0AAW4L016_9BACT|nr:ATP-binding protein [Geoanaerobacter pelophilus]MBT0664004.1 PAS domain-containing protein [Geoanaerobacter pelophilus]
MKLQFSIKSIKFRFFSTIALVLLAGTLALSAIIAVNEGVNQQSVLTQKGKGIAQYVSKLCLDALIMGNTVQIDSIVNEARYDEEILYIIIRDNSGKILTSQFASINYSSPHLEHIKFMLHDIHNVPQILEFIEKNESSVVLTSPITTGTETLGQVVVCLTKHNIISNIKNTISVIIVLNIAITIVLAILLFIVSGRLIFEPVSELANASRKLAKGDLTTRIDMHAVGEMQLLIDSFNQMAKDLQQTTVSKEYVNNIIKSMTEALLIISPDHSILDANYAAYKLLGYEPGELTGADAGKIFYDVLPAQVPTTADQGQKISTETCCQRKDGQIVPIYFTASVMPDNEGMIQGIVCTALDISPIKQVAEQLTAMNKTLQLEVEQRKQAQEEAFGLNKDLECQKTALELANLELESFSYSVSHDLRAPLRHINGFTNILREDYRDRLDDNGRDFLDRICAASSRMGVMIDDLLRFSRVSRAEMNVVDVDLSACAHKLATMFQESDPDRTTRFDIAEGLTTKGDASLLEMVLQNLIGNAWKYSSLTPEAVIAVGKIPSKSNDILYVKDNGVGFDMVYKDKLFTAFQRLHGKEYEGTGIGLATVHRIIERHGGKIWAESEVGKGATFYFSLDSAA